MPCLLHSAILKEILIRSKNVHLQLLFNVLLLKKDDANNLITEHRQQLGMRFFFCTKRLQVLC
jgi:hypothetical protein